MEAPEVQNRPRARQIGRFLALLCGGAVGLLAASALVGWALDVRALIQVRPTFAPMQPNTAVGFLLLGTALALLARERRVGAWVGGAAALIGGLTLVQYVSGLDLGIDRLLLDPHVTVKTSHAGRMAPNTAAGFLVAGGGLLAFLRRPAREFSGLGLSVAGAGLVGLGGMALYGYAAGFEAAYGWITATRMAAHTAFGMTVVGLAMLALARNVPAPEHELVLGPRALAVGAASFAVALVLWGGLVASSGRMFDRAVEAEAAVLPALIERELDERIRALERSASRWSDAGGTPRAFWEADHRRYLRDFEDLVGLAWLREDGRLDWTLSEASGDARLERAASRLSDVSEPRLVRIRDGIGIGIPLEADGVRTGTLLAVLDGDRVMADALESSGIARWLAVGPGDEPPFTLVPTGSDLEPTTLAHPIGIDHRGLVWELEVYATPDLATEFRPVFVEGLLVVSLVVSLLLAAGVQLVTTARARAARLARLNRELQETETDLRLSNQDLEQFAYVASHDLQEPLRMVSNYTQLLARRYRGRLDADADEFIDYAVDGARRMSRLLNDLLALSRVSAHRDAAEPVDCDALVDEILRNLSVTIEEAGARVQVDPLPPVVGDRSLVGQVFQNLLANAIRFRGEATPEIRVRARREGADVHFRVSDNGQGMDPAVTDRVFQIFQRLGRSPEGTGIGLAIVKKVVELHGGRVWVESAPGRGATFHFTLPAAESMPPEEKEP